MKTMIAATALFAFTATSAAALDPASTFVPACEAEGAKAGENNLVAAGVCGCFIGVIGGKTTPREFAAFEYIAPAIFDQSRMQSAIGSAAQAGYSQEEILGLANAMGSLETDGMRICGFYESRSTATAVSFTNDQTVTFTPMINMEDPSMASEIATFGMQLRQAVSGQ
ncbi:MAG: hypothetical protein AAGA69_10820 [Pseudomonadota bacterium]